MPFDVSRGSLGIMPPFGAEHRGFVVTPSVTESDSVQVEGDRAEMASHSIDAPQPPRAVPSDKVELLNASESFVLWNADHVRSVDVLVMADGRSVRDYLKGHPPITEIVSLTAEGIRRQGARCLGSESDRKEGEMLSGELPGCDTIESLLRRCAEFYTRETFLYHRVNAHLRSRQGADPETGRNLGLYIGLLRECFCVSSASNPLLWERPRLVYRGARFDLGDIIDYARRPDEFIRWQSFTSSSADINVALQFPGNVLFEMSLAHPVVSLNEVSAFQNEQEFVVSPYQWFEIKAIRWAPQYQRWIFPLREEWDLPNAPSWLQTSDIVSDARANPSTSD